jgi:tetratricopeptide (TPR) repeat protein
VHVPPSTLDPASAPTWAQTTPDSASASADREGVTDGRYTLRRELARGGMGRIWIGDDARLSRRVAIKELLEPRGAHAARFERELALTSRLEHPSIVCIHDGGAWSDGRPFYVMKLVSGESLDRVIARSATLAERIALLPRGLAIVDALAYAHAQGIVHRDLKPENVIVGEFGETVVIDWGLAKDLHATTPDLIEGPYRDIVRVGETIGGEVMGTPAYMPPEQALGDAVDERADVYALGAVLYHLVSGARPHRGNSVEEVLASVISDSPPPLATLAPGVPADLVAIVEKAMQRRPEDRYATAGELAVDLKRFLSGQLVGAHRYTGRQLLWRWLRKHRTAVIVASVAVLALATLGAVSFTRIVREEQHAQEARSAAEHNHAKAEGLVSFMLVDLREKLEPVGKLELLESVALEARSYYRDQADAKTADEQHRRALALHGLGHVLAAKGEAAAALTEHEAALAIHQRLAAIDPRWQPSLAASSTIVGDALRTRGDIDRALAAYQTSLAITKQRVASKPDDAAALHQLATAHTSLGDFYSEHRRDAATALREHQRAVVLHQGLVAGAPRDVARRRDLVRSHAAVADMQMQLGDFARAAATHEQALTIAKALAAEDLTDVISQNLLADRHEELGGVLHNQGSLPAATEHYQTSLAIRRRLVEKDPTNGQWRSTVARSYMNLGQVLDEQANLAGALEHHRAALVELEQLLRVSASNVRLRGTHAFVQRLVGSVLLRQHRVDDAIAAFEGSRVTTESLAAAQPADQKWQRDLVYLYSDLADAHFEREGFAATLDLRRRVLTVAEQIAASDPANASSQSDLVDVLVRLAETLDGSGEPEQAAATYRRALAIGERLVAQAPANPMWIERTKELRTRVARCCTKRAKR